MIDFSGTNNLSSGDNQFSFKAAHSTDTCIFVLKQVVEFYNRNSSPVFSCFIDASKAFDRVNHWTLFRKLIERNIPLIIVKMLASWYGIQKFSIKWGNSLSKWFSVTNGVRQGGIMSPLLYNVYIDDLNNELNKCSVGCTISGVRINNLSYADDMTLLAPSLTGLQLLVNICESYGIKHDILFNPKKSLCMVFSPKRIKDRTHKITLCGNELNFVVQTKYLGHILSYDLNDAYDIRRQYRSTCIRANMLCRKFKKCCNEVKCNLFKTYCTTLYCSSLWAKFTQVNIRELQVCYNNAFRKCMGLPRHCSASQMFVTSNVPSFFEYYRKTCYGFMNRMINSNNSLVNVVVQSCMFGSKGYATWMKYT